MKKASVFSREHYIAELAARSAEPPIGKKMTHIDVLREYGEREFMDFPLGTYSNQRKSLKTDKSIYRHNAYNDLFFETGFISTCDDDYSPPDEEEEIAKLYDLSKPIVSIYDFANEKMLVATQDKAAPLAALPLSVAVKRRLYNEYDLNAFPHKPFDTIENLVDLIPPSGNPPSLSEHGRQQETKHRSKWLMHYVETMFDIKARQGKTLYALPLFNNTHVLCTQTLTDNKETSDSHLEIQDLDQGRILDISSVYETFVIGSFSHREYAIAHKAMTREEIRRARNILFLAGKDDAIGKDVMFDFKGINFLHNRLPEIIDTKKIPTEQKPAL